MQYNNKHHTKAISHPSLSLVSDVTTGCQVFNRTSFKHWQTFSSPKFANLDIWVCLIKFCFLAYMRRLAEWPEMQSCCLSVLHVHASIQVKAAQALYVFMNLMTVQAVVVFVLFHSRMLSDMLTCTQGLTKDNDCYAATQHWLQSAMWMRS